MAAQPGIYATSFEKALINTAALDWELDTHKLAIYTNSIVPNFQTDTVYSATNEVGNSTGWPTGGVVLGTTALDITSDPTTYDGDNYSQPSTTFTSGEAGILYAAALANELLFMVDFVSPVSPSAGTFTITWHVNGIVTFDLVP